MSLGLLEEEDLVGLLEEEGKGEGASKEEGGDKQEGMQQLPAAQVGYCGDVADYLLQS